MNHPISKILALSLLFACNESVNKKNEPNSFPEIKESYWTSEFYFYRNVYAFNSNNQGVCYEHQLARTCPIDLEKQNISGDSMLLMDEKPFRYTLKDSTLLITFIPSDNDSIPSRTFTRIKSSKGEFIFKSNYEYAYGKEFLYPEPKWFKCCL